MNRMRMVGAVIMGLGAVILVIAAIGTLTGGGGDDGVAAPSTTRSGVTAPPTSSSAPSTTQAPTTTAAATTTAAPTTTMATTTTAIPALGPQDAVDFITEFSAAIASGDADFLFARLHSVVRGTFDDDLCRAFIDREILALVDYRATGDATSEPRTYTVGSATVEVDPLYVVPVTFTFQGQEFDGGAGVAPEEGEMRWFTECR